MSLKKIALESLKTKFEGIDEKVLSRIAAKLAKTAKDEEEIKTKVEETTLQSVIDAYTDSRVTDAAETAVKTYEAKHGLKDGKKMRKAQEEEEEEDDEHDINHVDDTPAYVKSLMKSISALSEEVSSLKEGKKADARRASLDKLLVDAPENTKKQILREFSRAKFNDDDDFSSWIDEITPDVEEASKEEVARRTAGQPPKGGGGDTKIVNPIVQARIDARKAETAAPAIQGLQTTNN